MKMNSGEMLLAPNYAGSPLPKICDTCRFYLTAYPNSGCHRHAPTTSAENRLPVWPMVMPQDSCGDWEVANITIEDDGRLIVDKGTHKQRNPLARLQ